MTSSKQDKIIAALASEHGAVKVLPLRGTDVVLACGWSEACDEAGDTADGGRARWWYVPVGPTTPSDKLPAVCGGYSWELRYATDHEVASALEQDAVHELLSAAGLRP